MGKNADGGSGRAPYIASDSLKSVAVALVIDALGVGPLKMWPTAEELKSTQQYACDENWKQNILFNDTPLVNESGEYNFNNVDVQWRRGSFDQEPIAGGFPMASADISQSLSLPAQFKKDTPLNLSFNGLNIDAVMLRFGLDQFYETKSNNDIVPTEVSFYVDMKDSSPGATWSRQYTKTISGKASRGYEWPVEIDLSKVGKTGPWSIRITRTTADSTDEKIYNNTFVNGVTVISKKKFSYPGVAYLAVRADATQHSSIPKRSYRVYGLMIKIPTNYNPYTREYATSGPGTDNGDWDGSFKIEWTNNPAWVLFDLLTNERYGLGKWLSEQYIDKWELYQIAKYCDELVPSGRKNDDGSDIKEPRFTFNYQIKTQEEAMRVIQMVASNFRGITFWSAGAVFTSQDRPRDPSYIFNNANVVGGTFKYSSTARRSRHNYAVVQWNDPARGCDASQQPVFYEPGIKKTLGKLYKIDVTDVGSTSRGQATRKGRWTVAAENKLTETVEFSTGFYGVQLRPGDTFGTVDGGRFGKDRYGRIKSVNGAVITLDRAIVYDGSKGPLHFIYVGISGRTNESVIVSRNNETFEIILDELVEPPKPGEVWGVVTEDAKPDLWSVLTAKPEASGKYTITALTYDPSIYDYVDSDIVLEKPSKWSGPGGGSDNTVKLQAPTGLSLTEFLYDAKTDILVGVMAQWKPGGYSGVRYFPSYRIDGGNWVELADTAMVNVEIKPVKSPSKLDFRVTAKDFRGNITAPADATINVLGKSIPPQDVKNYAVKQEDYVLKHTWTQNTELDYAYTEIREGVWETGTVVATNLKSNKFVSEIGASRYAVFTVKHRDTSGNWSINAASYAVDLFGSTTSDVLSVAEKQSFIPRMNQLTSDTADTISDCNTFGVPSAVSTALQNAYNSLMTFLNSKTYPYVWNSLSGPTNLGSGGRNSLNTLLSNYEGAYRDATSELATAKVRAAIAAGATDAMLKSGYVDEVTGKIKWDMMSLSAKTIFTHMLYMANFDNLIPNPNSEIAIPSGGWPTGAYEGAGVTTDAPYEGSRCRKLSSAGELVFMQVPCNSGDQFCFRAMCKGAGAIFMRWSGGTTAATSSVSSAGYIVKELYTGQAPVGTTYVEFCLSSSGSAIWADNLYARRMADALMIVDGAIKAQHLESVMSITSTIQSYNYVPGTSVAGAVGFKMAGTTWTATELGGAQVPVNLEIGAGALFGGRKVQTTLDRIYQKVNRVRNGSVMCGNAVSDLVDGWSYYGDLGCHAGVAGASATSNLPGMWLLGGVGVKAVRASNENARSGYHSQILSLPKLAPGDTARLNFSYRLGSVGGGSSVGVAGSLTMRLIDTSDGSVVVTHNVSLPAPNVIYDFVGYPQSSWVAVSLDIASQLSSRNGGDYILEFYCSVTPSTSADSLSSTYAMLVSAVTLVM